MHEEKLLPWRWAILVGMTILLVSLQFAFIIPGGAAMLVMQEYQCEPMAFSMIMSIPYFSGVLLCIAGGVLADRIGLGKVFLVAFVIAALGALGRCLAVDYGTLFAASFFMGTGVAALNANSAKLLRMWFPGTANSFAMGVYTAGMSGGAALAIYVGSHLPEIHQAWWISFGLIVVGLVVWFAVYRKHPDEHCANEPVGQMLREVLRDRNVWAIGVVAFLVFGMTNINGSYMVPAVTALMGDPAAAPIAGDLSTINTVITCIASMLMPVVFAKAFKNLRAPFVICLAVTGVTFAVTFFIPYGVWTWVAYLVILPVFMAAVMPFTKMLPTLIPDIKPEHYGVVGGIQATFQNVGMFLIASYVVSRWPSPSPAPRTAWPTTRASTWASAWCAPWPSCRCSCSPTSVRASPARSPTTRRAPRAPRRGRLPTTTPRESWRASTSRACLHPASFEGRGLPTAGPGPSAA